MKINKIEVDFKISRLKDAAAFEKALADMGQSEIRFEKEAEKLPITEVFGKMIKIFQDFFVTATGVDVLDGCEDFSEAKQAYLDFLEEITSQKKELLGNFSPDRIK